ncbi:hypothetical protein HAV15_012115 [Penicillium sp. str. |nr:hypothetical protein HAV15_012115 [Penicillium sp. str. \
MFVAGLGNFSWNSQAGDRSRILEQSFYSLNVSFPDSYQQRGLTPTVAQIEVDVRMLQQDG